MTLLDFQIKKLIYFSGKDLPASKILMYLNFCTNTIHKRNPLKKSRPRILKLFQFIAGIT